MKLADPLEHEREPEDHSTREYLNWVQEALANSPNQFCDPNWSNKMEVEEAKERHKRQRDLDR